MGSKCLWLFIHCTICWFIFFCEKLAPAVLTARFLEALTYSSLGWTKEQYAYSFTFLRQFQRLCLINPRVFLAFLEIEAICWKHLNLLFTVNPWYEIDWTWSSSVPQNVYLLFGGFWFINIHRILHFNGLNSICHWCCHSSTLCRSSCGWSQFASFARIPYNSASSAKSFTSKCSPLGRSFAYVKNSTGPKTVPYGTPKVTGEALQPPASQITVWYVQLEKIQTKWVGFNEFRNIVVSLTNTYVGLYRGLSRNLKLRHAQIYLVLHLPYHGWSGLVGFSLIS